MPPKLARPPKKGSKKDLDAKAAKSKKDELENGEEEMKSLSLDDLNELI